MEAGEFIGSKVDLDANIIVGAVHDDELGDKVCVTIVATGVSPRGDAPAGVGKATKQQMVNAGRGNSRSTSPNPFMLSSSAASAPQGAANDEKPAAAPPTKPAGGVQVPAFLRNMHRKK